MMPAKAYVCTTVSLAKNITDLSNEYASMGAAIHYRIRPAESYHILLELMKIFLKVQ
jgi:hypothetical protein